MPIRRLAWAASESERVEAAVQQRHSAPASVELPQENQLGGERRGQGYLQALAHQRFAGRHLADAAIVEVNGIALPRGEATEDKPVHGLARRGAAERVEHPLSPGRREVLDAVPMHA